VSKAFWKSKYIIYIAFRLSSCSVQLFSPKTEQKHLEKLKVTKSSGPDQLHPKYLHETAKNISTALATNFNISMETMTDVFVQFLGGI
jgi:hypothetical protein